MSLISHGHGKSKVRVARVWRDGSQHTLREWQVEVMLESELSHAYTSGSNEGMTATDTIKNIVWTNYPPGCSISFLDGMLAGV